METMQPTLKSGRNAWDRVNMPVEEFQERVKKIRKGMKEMGIDLLLLYGYAFNEYGNYCCLSNFSIRLPQGALVAVPKEGPLTLMFEGASRGIPSVRKMTWIEDLRATGDVSKECIQYLQEKNLVASAMGFAGFQRLMPNHQLEFIRASLPQGKIVNADPLVEGLRMVKSPLEILQIRRAARIVARGFDFMRSTSFAPLEEKVLEAATRREARLEGAEDFRMMIGRPSEERWAFRPPEERPLRQRECVLLYLGVEFERYWAEGARTFTVQDSSFVETRFEPLESLYETLMQGMKPGKKMSQFYREAMAGMKKAKMDFLSDYGLGQGIGLSPRELPLIAKEDRNILREGMCLSLRLGVRNEEKETFMIGDTISLSRKGPERLVG
jgi:Xaa-Pro aminopeptidase